VRTGDNGVAVADGLAVVAPAVPLLVDTADEEHLVVHRQSEQDREHQHRQERLDRSRLVDTDQRRPPTVLEDRGDQAERRAR